MTTQNGQQPPGTTEKKCMKYIWPKYDISIQWQGTGKLKLSWLWMTAQGPTVCSVVVCAINKGSERLALHQLKIDLEPKNKNFRHEKTWKVVCLSPDKKTSRYFLLATI